MAITYRGYSTVKYENLYLFHFNNNSSGDFGLWSFSPNSQPTIVTGEYQFGNGSLAMSTISSNTSTKSLKSGYYEKLSGGQSITIDFWIYLSDGTGQICKWNNNFEITATGENGNTTIKYIVKGVETTKTVQFTTRGWRHHAIIYDQLTSKIKFYYYGIKQHETTISLTEISGSVFEFSNFNGYLDEFRLGRFIAWESDIFTPPDKEYEHDYYADTYIEEEVDSGVRDLARYVENDENPIDVGWRDYQFL